MRCTGIATGWVSKKEKKKLFYLLDAKGCLLTENVHVEREGAYWMKKATIKWKYVYWPKKCLLNENVSINRKCAYWIKMCILKGHNHLGINSG